MRVDHALFGQWRFGNVLHHLLDGFGRLQEPLRVQRRQHVGGGLRRGREGLALRARTPRTSEARSKPSDIYLRVATRRVVDP